MSGPESARSANQVRVVPPRCAGSGPRPSTSPCSTTPPTRSIPGLEAEFVQQAKAFAAWCNASGGINGRNIVIDNRDAALFNAAQVTEQSCQSDFMAVGGGMALDQPSVPIREKCGLGQISGYVVSNASYSRRRSGRPERRQHQHHDLGLVRCAGQGVPAGGQEGRHGRGRTPPPSSSPSASTSSAPRPRGGRSSTSRSRRIGDRLGALCRRGPEQGGPGPVARPWTTTSSPTSRR